MANVQSSRNETEKLPAKPFLLNSVAYLYTPDDFNCIGYGLWNNWRVMNILHVMQAIFPDITREVALDVFLHIYSSCGFESNDSSKNTRYLFYSLNTDYMQLEMSGRLLATNKHNSMEIWCGSHAVLRLVRALPLICNNFSKYVITSDLCTKISSVLSSRMKKLRILQTNNPDKKCDSEVVVVPKRNEPLKISIKNVSSVFEYNARTYEKLYAVSQENTASVANKRKRDELEEAQAENRAKKTTTTQPPAKKIYTNALADFVSGESNEIPVASAVSSNANKQHTNAARNESSIHGEFRRCGELLENEKKLEEEKQWRLQKHREEQRKQEELRLQKKQEEQRKQEQEAQRKQEQEEQRKQEEMRVQQEREEMQKQEQEAQKKQRVDMKHALQEFFLQCETEFSRLADEVANGWHEVEAHRSMIENSNLPAKTKVYMCSALLQQLQDTSQKIKFTVPQISHNVHEQVLAELVQLKNETKKDE